ncbi:MAG: hypothetical protein JNK14_15940 [Chitinophagaceae bacterium]|nr:hypothetical protein [Chitinophagaceae bacterium]
MTIFLILNNAAPSGNGDNGAGVDKESVAIEAEEPWAGKGDCADIQ